MSGPSAIGAQPPPEDYDEEWLMLQECEEGDEPFCNCSAGHSIEETDWNQCDSCGKPIYDEEPAVPPAPTFADGMTAEDDRRFLEATSGLTHNALGQEPCAAVCARSPAPTGYTSGTTE